VTPFAHCPQETDLKRPDLATGLSDRFEEELRDGVARARAGELRRPNWRAITAMCISAGSLFIGSAAMGALVGDAVRNFLFIAALVPTLIVVALLHCDSLKLRS
jgi:hypothetical protein